jgi:hypothetical protein
MALEIAPSIAAPAATPASVDALMTAAITEADRPLPIGELRALCRIRNGTLYERLTALTDTGQIVRGPEGYRLATRPLYRAGGKRAPGPRCRPASSHCCFPHSPTVSGKRNWK